MINLFSKNKTQHELILQIKNKMPQKIWNR